MSQVNTLNEQNVAHYLQEYPDFFHQHIELLENLAIPEPNTGNVISLTAKQLELYRNKQKRLEQQLHSMIEIAKENSHYAAKLHQLTLSLLKATSLETTITNLHQALAEFFSVDIVALKILHENPPLSLAEFFISPDHPDQIYLIPELILETPRCGSLSTAQNRFLFAQKAEHVKSCAIMPLLFPPVTGLLVLGSSDENRFHHSKGNLFLTYLSQMVGTRLQTLLSQDVH